MNKKNDKFDVWYNSFKIIETMNKKGSIDELLSEALKILASITSSSDIQIYKESKSTKHITNYASLNKKRIIMSSMKMEFYYQILILFIFQLIIIHMFYIW